jgi:hypothetical protein
MDMFAAVMIARGKNSRVMVRVASALVGACVLLGVSLSSLVFGNCNFQFSCQNNAVAEKISPDGTRSAVWSVKRCGVVGRYCPSTSNIAVIGDSSPAAATVLEVDSDGGVDVEWVDSRHLSIRYPAHSRILKQVQRVADVRIECIPVGSM